MYIMMISSPGNSQRIRSSRHRSIVAYYRSGTNADWLVRELAYLGLDRQGLYTVDYLKHETKGDMYATQV